MCVGGGSACSKFLLFVFYLIVNSDQESLQGCLFYVCSQVAYALGSSVRSIWLARGGEGGGAENFRCATLVVVVVLSCVQIRLGSQQHGRDVRRNVEAIHILGIFAAPSMGTNIFKCRYPGLRGTQVGTFTGLYHRKRSSFSFGGQARHRLRSR